MNQANLNFMNFMNQFEERDYYIRDQVNLDLN